MPENAARKKRARLLSRATGVPYTASLNILTRRPELAQHILWPGDWLQRIGRPVAIISAPTGPTPTPALTYPGPRVLGCSAHDDQIYEIHLAYGSVTCPEAQISTTYALADGIHHESQLRMKLASFATKASTPRSTPRTQRDQFKQQMQALETALLEPCEVILCAQSTPATRLRLNGFEALEIHHSDAVILYCGREGRSNTLQLDLDQPRTKRATHDSANC